MAGKTAVVTGSTSGIGLRTVERLLDEGWTVWSLARSPATPKPGAEDRFRHIACDVSKPADVQSAMARIGRESEGIDALILSAGVADLGKLEDLTIDEVNHMMGVNIMGVWISVREALPLLRRRGTPAAPSRVVILGSISGIRPKVGNGFYAATKAAVHTMTGILGSELGPSGITVNAIAPGTIKTPMTDAISDPTKTGPFRLSGTSPLGRVGLPDDVADVVLFFLSDQAKYVNGTILPVDGGTRGAHVPG